MRLYIENKNNGNSYPIDDGFTYTQTLNETLDSAVVRLSHLTSKIDIEPFDEVVLTGDIRFSDIYMCVDNYTMKQQSFSDEITYTYEISLFSQTKLLENKILPNLSITQRYEHKRSKSIRVEGTATPTQKVLLAYSYNAPINKTIDLVRGERVSSVEAKNFHIDNFNITNYTITNTDLNENITQATYTGNYFVMGNASTVLPEPTPYYYDVVFRVEAYRNVWYYLNQYNNEFCEKRRYEDTKTDREQLFNDWNDTIRARQEVETRTYTYNAGSEFVGYELEDEPIINLIYDEHTRIYAELIDYDWDSTTATLTLNVEVSSDEVNDYSLEITALFDIYKDTPIPLHYANRFTFASRVQTRFENVIAPEMQWNNPTLKEVITDLMMIDDCIPIVKNGVIDYIDLTETKQAITNYNYVQESQSSDDYVSDIRMDMQNVMQTQIKGITNTTTTTELLTLTSDSNALTSQNGVLKTQFPILKINHLWLCIPVITDDDLTNCKEIYTKIDLCSMSNLKSSGVENKMIYEYKEYITKNRLYRTVNDNYTDIISREIDTYYSQYQNFLLYFNRGSNTIEGFGNETKKASGNASQTTLGWLRSLAIIYHYGRKGCGQGSEQTAINAINNINTTHGNNRVIYPLTFFQIEYETSTNQAFSAGKDEVKNNYREIADNQTNSWVDSYSQGKFESQKANRLGNKQYLINQRYENTGRLMNIGDIYDNDKVVYQTQYQIYKDHIESNGYAVKNYILRNYYTGISSKIRTWKNATDEAFIRQELVKYYCEFSYNEHIDLFTNLNLNQQPALYLVKQLDLSYTRTNIKPLKYALIQTTSNLTEYPSGTNYYSINLLSRLVGNSIVFSFGFNDNSYVEKHFKTSALDYENASRYDNPELTVDDIDAYGGVPYEYYKYTGDTYETQSMFWKFATDIYLTEDTNTSVYTAQNNLENATINVFNKPVVKSTELGNLPTYYETDYSFHKDNREIPFISNQFEFCSDTRDIYFTKYFLQSIEAIRTIELPQLKVYNSSSGFKYGSEVLPDNATEIQANITTQETTSKKGAKIIVSNENAIQVNSFIYIVDNVNNVLLAFKTTKTDYIHTIYLNLLRQRNKNVYKLDGTINRRI